MAKGLYVLQERGVCFTLQDPPDADLALINADADVRIRQIPPDVLAQIRTLGDECDERMKRYKELLAQVVTAVGPGG